VRKTARVTKPSKPKRLKRHQALTLAVPSLIRRAVEALHDTWAPAHSDPSSRHVHKLRVAVRELRVLLKVCTKLTPEGSLDDIRLALKTLAAEVGKQRDLDVLIEALVQPMQSEHQNHDIAALLDVLVVMRDDKQASTIAALESPSAQTLRNQLQALPAQMKSFAGTAKRHDDIASFALKDLKKRWRILSKAAVALDAVDTLDAANLHALRKTLKTMRYAFGPFAPLWGKKNRRAFWAELKQLQLALGYCNDVDTARALGEKWTANGVHPELHFTLGYVLGIHTQRAERKRRKLRAIWRRLEATKIGRALA
jgi:CHAD domain-containing protein